MRVKEEVERIEQLARGAGLSMKAACREAGMSAATFFRWKNGSNSPVLSKLEELENAIARHRDSKVVNAP